MSFLLSSFFTVPVSSMMGFPLRWVFFTFCFYCRSFAELGFCCPKYFREGLKQRMGFPCSSAGKESTCNMGDLGSIPGLGRSPGEGKGYPLQYSGPENSMDCIVHEVTKRRTQLSDFHFTSFHHDQRLSLLDYLCVRHCVCSLMLMLSCFSCVRLCVTP